MKMLVTAAAIAVAMGGSAVASASVFDFSYAFTGPGETGQLITGSFDGTSTNGGQTVSDITDLQVSLNGIAFAGGAGPLQLNAWNTSTESYDDTTPVVISATESQNNFAISDTDLVSGSPNYYFTLVNDPVAGNNAVAANFLQSDSFSGPGATQLALDDGTGSWSLTAAPVPLPAALPLLLSGLGGLGAFGIGRRRRAA